MIGAIPAGRRAIGASADERRDWRPKHDLHVLRGCEAVLVFPVVKLLDFKVISAKFHTRRLC
ncbi:MULTISPECIES: hypothetical protein [unclassified Thiocapsa]|uniref:hypothetical protein n=1 Tax=unclassified Thiocapsa TaxID=2641286 RepID=UPI0035B1C1B0